MNDQLLSQNLNNYDEATRKTVESLIEQERQKTRAMLTASPLPPAVLIGSVSGQAGLFNAIGE